MSEVRVIRGFNAPALGAFRTAEQKEWSRKFREGRIRIPWLHEWEQTCPRKESK